MHIIFTLDDSRRFQSLGHQVTLSGWLRGGGRAGLSERVLISGEPNRGEVGWDMGRRCDLTRGSPDIRQIDADSLTSLETVTS